MGALCWLDHTLQPRGLVLGPVAVLLTILATGEALHLLRAAGARLAAQTVYLGAVLPVIAVASAPFVELWSGTRKDLHATDVQHFAGELLGPALLLGVAICGIAALRGYDGTRQAAMDFAASVFIVTYIGGALAMLALLRLFSSAGTRDGGLLLIVATVVIVKSGDTGAYTVGRLFGRHKLAPRLSPGKTWEGAIGAVIFSGLAGWVIHWVSRPENVSAQQNVVHLVGWLSCSVALSVIGMVGDLSESLLKRSAAVKDSSTWMPGFGGVLDVLDSLLLSSPIAYWFAWLGLIEP